MKAAAFITMTKSPNAGDIASVLTTKYEQIDSITLRPTWGWDIRVNIHQCSNGPSMHPTAQAHQ